MAGRLFIIILMCSFCEMQKQAPPQAKLIVYPPVIKETESVSLSCEAPSHVSVHQCYFYVNRGTQTPLSCEKTFTGSDLLRISQQTSPAVVEVRCFYSAKIGGLNPPSPHSDTSYITIGPPQAKLIVYPPVIKETESVSLSCEAPSHVSVHQCYFYVNRGTQTPLSCEKTFTGSDLLRISQQSSPAVVEVRCFYSVNIGGLNPPSPHSDTSYITIGPPQAKLIVYPPVIKETESVSLSCEAPSHVSVHQCYFYVNRGTQTPLSCEKTFTGSDLLRMSEKTSPAVVEVRCFYSVKIGGLNPPSPHSDTSYITIGLKPQMSMNHFKGDQTIFTCSLPGSVKHDTTCNLYFGEANHPVETKNIMMTKSSKNIQRFCQFFIPEGDLLRRLHSVQQKDASCDYSLEGDVKVLSPRSDPYSLADFVESESGEIKTTQMFTSSESTENKSSVSISTTSVSSTSELQTILTSASTKGQAVPEPQTSAGVAPVQVTSVNHNLITKSTFAGKTTENVGSGDDSPGKLKWKWLLGLTAAGLTVGVLVFVLLRLRAKRHADIKMKTSGNTERTPAGKERVCSVIQSEADCPTASDEPDNQRKQQNDDSDVYHVYSAISDILPAATKMDLAYSLLQNHSNTACGHNNRTGALY